MAVKYSSTLSKYKASSDVKTGGVHNEGLYHIWTPDKNKNEYNQLVRQGKAEYGKDFESTDELRAFLKTLLVGVKTNGSAPAKVTNSMLDEADEDTLYALIANASHDKYRTGKKEEAGDHFDVLHGGWVKAVRKGIDEFKSFKNLVNQLEAKNLSENQINQFLSSDEYNNKFKGQEAARLDILAEDVAGLTNDDFATQYGVTNDKDADGNPTGIEIGKAANAEALAKDEIGKAEEVLDTQTFGDATSSEGLTKVPETTDTTGEDTTGEDTTGEDTTGEDTEPKAGDEFTDADGKTVVLGTDGKYYYLDGTEYISPDQNTVPREIESDQASSDAAEEVVDESVQNVAAGADTAANIQTSVLGGDVSTGVAEQLGWQKGTKEVDGKTVTTFTDPRTNTTYDVDPDSGMLTDTEGNTVSTVGSLNFEENDFAQQFTNAANDFLYGAALTEQAALSLGFTKTGDTYTGPDGQSYTLNEQGQLVDEGNNVARSDGFLDYQTQLQNANAEYTTAMEGPDGLLSKYEQTFSDYQSDFQPRMDQLDSNISALNQVATDAGDRNYYNQLRDVYFADSMDQISRDTESSRDAINQMYANSGMDTSSPAYTSAMVDLQNKRSDATRSARRQAILDSYGLGSEMLTNRTNALSNAQTGIRAGMDALSDLYDVKLEGLGTERDMISTIYEGKKEGAKLGMEGLGVTAGLERDKINANQSQYFKDLDVRTGLNQNTVNTNVTAANTANTADVNATDDYWTGMGWLQTLVDNDFDWRAAGAAIQTQFPDFDTSTLDEKLQVKFGFK